MYSSYKNLFTIKWKIYSIGDRALPRPIPLDSLGLFLLFLLPSYYLALPLSEFLGQARMITAIITDGLLTYAALQYDPQGRPFFIYVRDLLAYLLRPARQDINGSRVAAERMERLEWTVPLGEERGE